MHTLTINVNDSFYPHFKALLESLAQSRKLEYVEQKNGLSKVEVNSLEEVQKRVALAEERVASGNYVKEELFWNSIDKHMEKYAH